MIKLLAALVLSALLGCAHGPRTAALVESEARALLDGPAVDGGASSRDGARVLLAWLALGRRGEVAEARRWLDALEARPDGEAGAVQALVAAHSGDLRAEAEGWMRATRSADPRLVRLAVLELVELIDWLPAELATQALSAGREALPQAPIEATRLAVARLGGEPTLRLREPTLTTHRTATPLLELQAEPELTEPAVPARVTGTTVALDNPGSALIDLIGELPPLDVAHALEVRSRCPFRAYVGEREALERDPVRGQAGEARVVRLPPSTSRARLTVRLACAERLGRAEILLVPSAYPGTPTQTALPGLSSLARARLALARGDLETASVRLAAARVRLPQLPELARLEAETLGTDATARRRVLSRVAPTGHAAVLRALGDLALSTGKGEQALRVLDQLPRPEEPRHAFLRFRTFRDLGWNEEADRVLDALLTSAPESCEAQRARLDHRWERLKLGARATPVTLPERCRHRLAARTRQLVAEVGEVAQALARLDKDVPSPEDSARFERARLQERHGATSDAASTLDGASARPGTELEADLRLLDLAAQQGDASLQARAVARAQARATAAQGDRVRLAALGHDRVWERFDPPTLPLLSAALPPGYGKGRSAVLLLDHHLVVRYADGSALHHTHQVLRLLDREALDDLGEATVPDGAHVLFAATRKATGAVLEIEDLTGKETVSFPELETGDAIELSYLHSSPPDAAALGDVTGTGFYFRLFEVPTWRASFVAIAREGTPTRIEARGLPEKTLPEKLDLGDGWSALRWTADAQPHVRAEPLAVAPFDDVPQVRVWSGATPEVLCQQRHEALLGLASASPAVRAELRRHPGLKGEKLARALVARLMKDVVEESGASFTRSAGRTLTAARGERAVALVALLRAAELDAELVLAQPILRHHAPTEVPNPGDLAHPLVRVRDLDFGDQDETWLDLTTRDVPYGFVSPTVRGRPAYVVGPVSRCKPVSVPTTTGLDERHEATLELDVAADGALVGTLSERVRSLDAASYRTALRGKAADERKKMLTAYLQALVPGAEVTDVAVEGLDALEQPVSLTVRLTRGAGAQLTLGLMPGELVARHVQMKQRSTTMVLDRFDDLALRVTVRLAPGVTLKQSLPPAVRLDGPMGRYERHSGQEGGTLTFIKRFVFSPRLVTAAQYADFVAFAKAADEGDALVLELALPKQ